MRRIFILWIQKCVNHGIKKIMHHIFLHNGRIVVHLGKYQSECKKREGDIKRAQNICKSCIVRYHKSLLCSS